MKFITDINGNVIPALGLGTAQEIDGTSASAATAAVIHATENKICRLACTADVRIAVAASPTAVATGTLLPAGAVEYLVIPAAMKIAVLGGKLSITIMV
ncbi:MAG TPA: hypothetical protein PKI15_10335 [Candidatus Cloacimonadota bacterium]|nr:hypothetical protein [Candidatus Cloacimonadota bacterium]